MDYILITEPTQDYELLDSGDGQKLERCGSIVVSRPDPQVLWSKSLPKNEWDKADAVFLRGSVGGKWKILGNVNKSWDVSFDKISFSVSLQPSKHLGVFPEQLSQWRWLEEKIKAETAIRPAGSKVKVLNLFGYTGGASLFCARAGAEVCHVDASKFVVDLANQNMKSSNLAHASIRFIVDDVRKFVEREIKRGNKYDVVIMDPPVYGKGVKGEVWKIEKDLLPLLSRVSMIVSSSPVALVINGYASVYSSIAYAQMLSYVTPGIKGDLSHGELTIREKSGNRLLPCGVFARWSK
ncbi:MAG: class I SAM-dependent methyltransferase [Parcubacteria group bacterium]